MNNFLKILFIILIFFYLRNNKYNIIFGGSKKATYSY